MTGIAAIVLAAGRARRFGADKLLQPISGSAGTLPLMAYALQPWLQVFDQVTVVIRPDMDATWRREVEIALPASAPPALRWVECEGAAQGMSASVACGVGANDGAAGWLIGLADMPLLPSQAVAAVRDAIIGGAALAAPFCAGRRGHPVGFAADYRQELLDLRGDEGARQLLQRDAASLRRVEIVHDGIFIDVDLPEDLHNLRH